MSANKIRIGPGTRQLALDAVRELQDGDYVSLHKKSRSLDQNALLHALFSDVSRQAKHHGRTLTPTQWKVLFISAHAIATGDGVDMVPGLEGEFCNIRESSARMSVGRMASLIEYVLAYCANNRIATASADGIPGWK